MDNIIQYIGPFLKGNSPREKKKLVIVYQEDIDAVNDLLFEVLNNEKSYRMVSRLKRRKQNKI